MFLLYGFPCNKWGCDYRTEESKANLLDIQLKEMDQIWTTYRVQQLFPTQDLKEFQTLIKTLPTYS